jgi:NADPH-dependent curcumin reductase CurA
MPSAQTNSLSMDPAKRSWMNDNQASGAPPVGLVELMRALASVRVVASNHPGFAVGTVVGQVAQVKGAPVMGIAGAGKPLAARQQRAARRF